LRYPVEADIFNGLLDQAERHRMRMRGRRQFAAARPDVWAKLNDAEVLKRCLPGCEALEKLSDTEFKARVAVKIIGPVAARFTGDVKFTDINPPASYRIGGNGTAGPAGMVSGAAAVHLEENLGGTLLTYDVDAAVSGNISQLGPGLIAAAAQPVDMFFDNFARELEGRSGAVARRRRTTVSAEAPRAVAPNRRCRRARG
jgi:carbon monoxide dehydrogenase subunit G